MHLTREEWSPDGKPEQPESANRRIARRLAQLGARHERAVARLTCLPPAELEGAFVAMRRFERLRLLMFLRLLAARACSPSGPRATREAPLLKWPELLHASIQLERLTGGVAPDDRP